MELAKTPLYQEHLLLQAKMAAFAGFMLPLSYGSALEEHRSVRSDAGVFDVSHMNVVDFTGQGAHDYLRYLLTNDIDILTKEGQALYSCMLNTNGGVVDDLIIYKLTNEHYRMVVNAATREKDLAWFFQHKNNFQVEITPLKNYAMLAIQGPNAIKKTQKIFNDEQKQKLNILERFQGREINGFWIARTGYTGEDGYEIILPAEKAAEFWQQLLVNGVSPCGLIARDSLRLEAGMRLYGADMDESVTPLESGLTWVVSFTDAKRNFIGKNALLKQQKDGVKQKLVGLILQDKGVLRSHQKVIVEGIGEGITTSGGFSPTLGVSIAFARVPVATKDKVFVEIREKKIPAKVVKANFLNLN